HNKMLEAYQLCAQTFEAMQDYQQAFNNTKLYSELAERTMGDQRKSQTERMQAIAQAEQAQHDAEIERLRNVELKEAYTQIEKQQESIVSSIRYASRIQQSILPSPSFLTEHFKDSFLLFKPRDIVSGDFYWFTMAQGRWVVAAIDCTGHGVPGAFMVVLGNTLLADIVLEQGIIDPGQIIHAMDERVTKTLGSGDTQANDGMDVAMVVYNPQDRSLAFAGAKNPLYYVRQGEMNKIKGSASAIGGQRLGKKPKKFETHHLTAEAGDRFYIFSDGYQDQFGGPDKSKFLTKNFRNLLHELHSRPMAEQQATLEQTLAEWMGEERQTDDIIVIGMQID
ncbi:MAG: SpoIIE family protein phosphatase, partial [Bacteroidota bacterium]